MFKIINASILSIASLAVSTTVMAEIYSGPIADAHAHLPGRISVGELSAAYEKAGVEDAVIFVNPFKGGKLKKIKSSLGDGFLLFPDVHKGKKRHYHLDSKKLSRMGKLYKKGIISGIGEVYFDLSYAPFAPAGIKNDIRSSDELSFFREANQLSIPIHFHHENPEQDVSSTLREFSNIPFILSHSGYLKPSALDQLMSDHDNLFADLSLISNYHFGPFKEDPLVKKEPSREWKELLVKHQDRFMVGSDIGSDSKRVAMLSSVIEDYRVLLGGLPDDVAKKIAYQNFKRVFKK